MPDELKDILHSGVKKKTESKPVPDETEGPVDVGPCGWVWVKGCRALDVERGGSEPVIALQYVFIAVISEFNPTKFWVEFMGEKTWRVTVEGRNLRPLFDRMQDHCLRKIRQADRDFGGEEGKPFVTKIDVQDVTPKDKEGLG